MVHGYHSAVRRLFLIALIALLPLRGWAGDLMAVSMAAKPAMSQGTDAMAEDCPLHAQAAPAASRVGAAAPAPAHADAHADTHADAHPDARVTGSQSCCSCDLCLPMAETAVERLHIAPRARHTEPSFVGVSIVSVPAARPLEPPIS
jgi:hypothetical protein